MEDAARRQVDTALTTALGRGEIAGFVHLPHQRRGGGFAIPRSACASAVRFDER
jgi:hypothetical protein